MNNVRGLYPPLYGAPANGGGGGGGSIQVDTLPEASLEYKDKIVQYTGATTETLTNGYFYKCIEHTETEGETITVTYSWDNIPVMEVESGGGYSISTTETDTGITFNGKPVYCKLIPNASLPAQFSIGANAVKLTTDASIETIVDSAFIIRYSTYFKLVIRGNVFVTTTYGEVEWSGQGGYNISSGDIDEKELVIWYTKKS